MRGLGGGCHCPPTGSRDHSGRAAPSELRIAPGRGVSARSTSLTSLGAKVSQELTCSSANSKVATRENQRNEHQKLGRR